MLCVRTVARTALPTFFKAQIGGIITQPRIVYAFSQNASGSEIGSMAFGNYHCFAGSWISPDPACPATKSKRTKSPDLDAFAKYKRIGDVLQDELYALPYSLR